MDSWMGTRSNPSTLHKYSYVYNSPVNYTDPLGLFGLASFSVAQNIRSTLATTATASFRSTFTKALWGEVGDFAKGQLTEAAFGVIGQHVVGHMVNAVEGTLDAGQSAQSFGSTAHKRLKDLIDNHTDDLNKYLKQFNAEVQAEIFRHKNGGQTGNGGKNREKGSIGLDVIVTDLRTGKTLIAFDLKTGKTGTSAKKAQAYRSRFNGASIIDIFVSRKK